MKRLAGLTLHALGALSLLGAPPVGAAKPRHAAASPPIAAEPISYRSYARPGRLVPSPYGGRINLRCSGSGSPTVVLTAGAGEQSLTWRDLQAKLAARVRTCAWDRPGFGFSDPAGIELDANHLTDSLEAALRGGSIRPPYILVGHSLGSFESLLFAFRHTRDVAGIVLIDPAGPFQGKKLKRAAPATYGVIDRYQSAQLAQLESCIAGGIRNRSGTAPEACASPPDPAYPPILRQVLARRENRIEARKAMRSLLRNMFSDTNSRELMQAWHSLGAIPLIVLTAGEAPRVPVSGDAAAQMPALQAAWSAMHDDIARLSTRGVNRTVSGAGHYIYKDRPEAVLGAVDEVVNASHAHLPE